MRKFAFIAFLIFFASGCAFVKNQKANWEACQADAACLENAKNWQAKGEVSGELIATGVATVVPGTAPLINPAKKVFGYACLGFAMLIGGSALRKKKEAPSV